VGIIDTIFRTRKSEFTFGPIGAIGPVIRTEKAYLNILLLSCRVVDVRRGLKKFYGAVHSFTEFDARNSLKPRVQVTSVTTPAQLKSVDASNLDQVITLTQRLLGPVPYRGGDVKLEAGLFSVKEADLAAPFLEVLDDLSSVAGTSVIGAALPFAGPLVKAFDLLAGAPDAAQLEIGVSNTMPAGDLRAGTFVVMRAPVGTVNVSTLRLDPTNRVVGADGKQIQNFPYFVYQISATTQRADFFRIPELARTHEGIQTAIRQNRDKEARELLPVFKRFAMTSSDLLLADGARLAKLVEDEVNAIVGAPASIRTPKTRAPKKARAPKARGITPLKDVPLFVK